MPAYSPLTNAIVFDHGNNPAQVAVANLDGSNAEVISGNQQGTAVRVSSDGKFAFYQGQNMNQGADIYAVPLSQPGPCKQVRLSQLNMRFVPPVSALIITTSSIDPASGKNEIRFSDGNVLHGVVEDGTPLSDLTLGDPENGNAFHRIGRNPAFPDVLWYKRDRPAPDPGGIAEPEIWIVNLKSPAKVYNLMPNTPVDHPAWSPDGRRLGFIITRGGRWNVADVVRPDGSFNSDGGGNFKITEVGPPYPSGLSVNFCTYSPDGSVFVCAQRNIAIYLMSLDGTKTKILVNPNSSPTGAVYNAIPKPRFLDMGHIIFTSDRTGLAQVYVISGFTTNFP
jgi:Tol biopolymer transport system component